MEGFRSSPVPTLRIYEASHFDQPSNAQDSLVVPKPAFTRRATDPTPSSPLTWAPINVAYRPRNTSPYSRGHVRSHSSAASTSAPPLSRANSMPGMLGGGFFNLGSPVRPSSPKGSPNRNRAMRKPVDEVFPGLPNHGLRIDTVDNPVPIPEEEEETPKLSERSSSPGLLLGNTYPRQRRPSSPLRNLSIHNPTSGGTTPTSPSSVASSPLYHGSRYDSFGAYSFPASASSVPTTPSSLRSRSPSISSLETIPDSPDAEEAALEAERIAQLKAAADAADGDEANRQGIMDMNIGRGRKLGTGFGSRDKSKRWSVCGAERRGDLDLETIWED